MAPPPPVKSAGAQRERPAPARVWTEDDSPFFNPPFPPGVVSPPPSPFHGSASAGVDVAPGGGAVGTRALRLSSNNADSDVRDAIGTLGGIALSTHVRDLLWAHVTLSAKYPQAVDGDGAAGSGAPSPAPLSAAVAAQKSKGADKRKASAVEKRAAETAEDEAADAAAEAAEAVEGGVGGATFEWREMSDAPSPPPAPWGEVTSPVSDQASARSAAQRAAMASSIGGTSIVSESSPLEIATARATSAAETARGGTRAALSASTGASAGGDRARDDDGGESDVETDDARAASTGVVAAKKWHTKTINTLVALSSLMTGPVAVAGGGARKRRATDAGDGFATPQQGGDLSDITNGIGTSSEPLSFCKVTQGATRRFAAQTFRELLILKSWDVVDVKQREPYGDIAIARTVSREGRGSVTEYASVPSFLTPPPPPLPHPAFRPSPDAGALCEYA